MEEVFRPEASRSVSERVHAWLEWFGLSRLIASAVAVVIVCGGAYWLVRTPPPPSEAALPRVQAAGVPISTLPLPPAAPTSTVPSVERLTIHVAGAVTRPGVYALAPGARVHEAIERAGGVGADADADVLNLAAPLSDGSRIYVPTVGETVPIPPPADPSPADADAVDSSPSGPLDVNQVTAAQLDVLPGVGPATASAIVTERQRNGPFLSVDDLERVPGIGPAKLASIRDLVTV